MLDWTLVTLLFIILAAGLVLHRFLRGPSLRAYDPPRPVRLLGVKVAAFGDRPKAATGEPQALSLLPAA